MATINLHKILEEGGTKSNELPDKIGIPSANLSILKTGKAKAVRFSTLEAICEALECQPGDIFMRRPKTKKSQAHCPAFYILNFLKLNQPV